jgi:hypothetical protein
MKKIGFLFMTAFLLILTSCSNPEKRAQEIVNDFETKIKEVGFEIKNSTFRDLLDKYKTDLEDQQIESLVNEKLADIINKKLEEYVLKINISKKIGSGNVGSFLEMQEAGPLNIKVKDGEIRIPFEAVLKEPYSLSFEYDFTTLGAQLLDDNGNELDDNSSCDFDFEKLINNQSQSEKGEIVFSLEKIQGYGSTKNLIKKYIDIIEKLNDIKDVNLKINRGKNASGVPSTNSSEESEVTPEESDVKLSDTECDEFLEEFDDFADEYVAFTKKYKKNPKDPSLVNEALELDAQIADWEKKSLQYGDCKDADFIKRLAGIQSKLTSAATNLFK